MRILERLAARQPRRGDVAVPSPAPAAYEGPPAQRARVAAAAMRAPALALLGHAECLVKAPAEGPERAQAVAAIAREMLDLADELEEDATAAEATRILAPEPVALGALIDDVVETVLSAIIPGKRLFRVTPGLAATELEVDRRALRQVLNRVLTSAARNTREGDWIEIMSESRPDSFALVVADEGSGMAGCRGRSADRRGLGFGLALSRNLMEAHGGSLAVESIARVGTRVTLFFPNALVISPLKPALA